MKIFMHLKTGQIILCWQAYASVHQDEIPSQGYNLTLNAYEFVGLACENEHGVTILFPLSVLKEFEYIGEL